jgi:hypothetical protein
MTALAATLTALFTIGLLSGARGGSTDASRATTAARGIVWAFSSLIVVEALLGFLRILTARNVSIVLVGLAVAAFWKLPPRAGRARAPLSRIESAVVSALAGAFLLLLWRGLHQTDFPYDSLSYHLHAPVTWMHEQRLTIVPAVFGGASPAYEPSNVELWFLSLIAPLRSEYLAGCGQIALAALAVASIVAAVREAGGHRTAALAAGLAFLLIPEVWEQAPTAMVDVGLAAFLLASVPFARRTEVVTGAAALGLAIGSKFVGLMLALPFLAFLAFLAFQAFAPPRGAQRAKWTTGWLVVSTGVVVFATGGFWYLRNLVVTGNPVFPGTFPGLHLPALYDRAAMRGWDYHVPIAHLGVLVSMIAGSGVGFATALVVSFARRPRSAEAVMATVLIVVFWFAIPYQNSRFLFPAFGMAAIAIGRAAPAPPAILGWVPLYGAVVGGVIQGTAAEWVALPVAAAVGWFGEDLIRRASRRTRAALGAAAAGGLAITLIAGFGPYVVRDPPYGVPEWSWFRAHVRDTRVAYTGANLAFPLAGVRLGNQVSYVNVAGQPDDRLHDFARCLGAGPGTNPEPALYRSGAAFDAWWGNLRVSGATVLFVSQLHPIVRRNIAADADGFPIERSWADAHPEFFTLEYASSTARIYAIGGRP